MPFGKPIDTAKAPKGFGKPIDTASDGPVQRPASPPMIVDPPVPEAPVSTLHGPTQGDYSRPTQARGMEGLDESMIRLFGGPAVERQVPMGDIASGYLPSHAAAESTNPFPDIQRPVIEQERPAGLTWDQAQVVMGDLTREQEEAAQQAQPAGDFGADPDDPSSYGLNFGAGALRRFGPTALMTGVGSEEGAESFGGKASTAAGEAVGTLLNYLSLFKGASAAGMGPISASTVAGVGDAVMQPGPLEERIVAGMQAAPGAALFGAAPLAPGVGRLVRSNVTGPAIDTAAMYATNKASGMSDEDAMIHAAAMAGAGRLAHVGGRGEASGGARGPKPPSGKELTRPIPEMEPRGVREAEIAKAREAKKAEYRSNKEARESARAEDLPLKDEVALRQEAGIADVERALADEHGVDISLAERLSPEQYADVANAAARAKEQPNSRAAWKAMDRAVNKANEYLFRSGAPRETVKSLEPPPSVEPQVPADTGPPKVKAPKTKPSDATKPLNPSPEDMAPKFSETPWAMAMKQEKAFYDNAAVVAGVAASPMRRSALKADLRAMSSEMRDKAPGGKLERMLKDFDNTGDLDKFLSEYRAEFDRAKAREAEIADDVDAAIEMGALEAKDRQTAIDARVAMEAFPELNEALSSGKLDMSGYGRNEAQFVDMRRISQGLGGGKLGSDNLVDRFFWRVNEAAHLSTGKISDQVLSRMKGIVDALPKGDRKIFGEIMRIRDDIAGRRRAIERDAASEDPQVTGQEMAEAAERSKFQIAELEAAEAAAMSRASSPDAVRRALSEMRVALDDIHRQRSDVRGGQGDGDVGYLDDYWPVIERQPRWYQPVEKIKRLARPRIVKETQSSNQKASSRFEKHRRGLTTDRETDPYRIIQEYARDSAKKIGHSVAIDHNNKIAALFEMYGYDDAANIIRQYNDSAYLNQPVGLDVGIQGVANANPVTRVAAGMMEGLGQGFKRAMFSLNLKWSLLTQGSSVLLAAGKHPELAPSAALLAADPSFRSFIRDTYSFRMKNRKQGSIVSNLEGDTVLGRRGGKLEAASDILEFIGRSVENTTMYYSGAISYLRGMKLLQQGKLKSMSDVANYVSDGMAKTQSMYDRYNRAAILNSKVLSSENPAQSFKVELMNFGRELLGNKYGTYTEYSGAQAVRVAAQVLAATMAYSYMTYRLMGHKTYTATTAVPFVSGPIDAAIEQSGVSDEVSILEPFLPDRYGTGGYSEGVMTNLAKAAREFAEGKEERGLALIARMYMPAGAQVSRGLQTIAAEKGEYPFELETTADKIISPLFGPYSTPSGRDYIDSIGGGGSAGKPTGRSTRKSGRTGRRSGR